MSVRKRRIDGFKISYHHMVHLEQLQYATSQKLPASAIVMYLLAHQQCNAEGLIPKKLFNLKELARIHGLPYTSLHNGKKTLEEHTLIITRNIDEQEYYEIPLYKTFTNPGSELLYKEKTSQQENYKGGYFYFPHYFINNGFLSGFIRHRDADGLMGLIRLTHHLSTSFSINETKKRKYTLKTLKQLLRKSLKSIWYTLVRLKEMFTVLHSERENTFYISLNEKCFKKESDLQPHEKKVLNQLSYDLEQTAVKTFPRLKYLVGDYKDIGNILIEDVVKVLRHWNTSEKAKTDFTVKVHTMAINEIIERERSLLNNPKAKKPVENLPGLYRTQLRQIFLEQIYKFKLLKPDDRLMLRINLIKHSNQRKYDWFLHSRYKEAYNF